MGLGHILTWRAQQLCSPPWTLETVRKPVQQRRSESELGQVTPRLYFSNPSPCAPRRP